MARDNHASSFVTNTTQGDSVKDHCVMNEEFNVIYNFLIIFCI